LLINLAIAFVPAAAIGLALKDWIDEKLFGVGPVIVAQVVGAFLMLFAESWRRKHFKVRPADDNLSHMPPHQAAGIGALQVLSLWPGMSRSMTTIVGGYFCGLEPRRAAEFSFLLGFLTAHRGHRTEKRHARRRDDPSLRLVACAAGLRRGGGHRGDLRGALAGGLADAPRPRGLRLLIAS